MSIRLNKAIRELNIGLQTAVEFLEKKQTLGEVKSDPNFSLNDEQYKALVDEFKTDKDVKNDAVKLSQKKQKEQASEKKIDHRAESLLNKEHQQQYKPLGKIDLESMGKKPTNQPSTSEPIIDKKEESDIDSLFSAGGTSALMSAISGLDDFELICFLVIK